VTAEAEGRRAPWEDPRVVAGTERVLARRAELIAAGAEPLGWKLGLGTEAAMAALDLSGPLVGFLTSATAIPNGGEVDVAGWAAPKLEPEVAIHLGPRGRGVAAVAAAIEIADVDRPPTETEEVLAGDIFHRAVILGEPVAPPDGPIAVRVERDGEEIAATDDAEAAVGRLADLAAYVSEYLAHFGAETGEGEVIISGSTVPFVDIAAGQSWSSRVSGVGTVGVRIG
jgi:2-keto-4-pentenoate hydratase